MKEGINLSRKLHVPIGDAVHAVIARDMGAMLVTRDNHFKLLLPVVESRKPEEL